MQEQTDEETRIAPAVAVCSILAGCPGVDNTISAASATQPPHVTFPYQQGWRLPSVQLQTEEFRRSRRMN
jgi:hypothetical protein